MTLPDALEHYKAARQHVHEAMDARDPARLAAALQVESMWERIVDRKRLTIPPTQPSPFRAVPIYTADMLGAL